MLTKNGFNFGKLLIFTVGMIFLLYSFFLAILLVYGTKTYATITSYRQEYGERNETIRNQYTYLYGYEFEVNGKTYSGNGQRIGNSVFLKNNGTHKIPIRYLSFCPYLNSAFDSKNNVYTLLIFLGIGILLIALSRKLVLVNE